MRPCLEVPRTERTEYMSATLLLPREAGGRELNRGETEAGRRYSASSHAPECSPHFEHPAGSFSEACQEGKDASHPGSRGARVLTFPASVPARNPLGSEQGELSQYCHQQQPHCVLSTGPHPHCLRGRVPLGPRPSDYLCTEAQAGRTDRPRGEAPCRGLVKMW